MPMKRHRGCSKQRRAGNAAMARACRSRTAASSSGPARMSASRSADAIRRLVDRRLRGLVGANGLGHAASLRDSSQRIPSRGAQSHDGSTVAAYTNS